MKILLLLIALALAASAQAPFTVEGKANIFAAGQAATTEGEVPLEISFNPKSVEAVKFTGVGGVVSNGVWNGGPDGSVGNGEPDVLGTMIESTNGLSSLVFLKRFAFLTGVFLGSSAPEPQAPAGLIFTNADTFETLSPLVGQTFFVGDGLTGTGSGAEQIFVVPQGATRLFLGVSDACIVHTFSAPSCYGDNSGGFTGKITFLSKTNGTWTAVDSSAASVHAAAH